ncbi:MAG TPA: AraC family transcriptional regulator [Longimicrobiaceae bacterium]|nr:AraC family transcriptional regulator [Longimicrobiaceae bacterium]
MPDAPPPLVHRHESPTGSWEVAHPGPDARPLPCAARVVGFAETPRATARRRELPSLEVPLILSFGAPYRVAAGGASGGIVAPREGFAAGLGETYALTETTGAAACVQVNLDPVGARLLLGVPMSELAGRAVGVAELFGAEGVLLVERLHDAAGWAERLALARSFVDARLAAAGPPCPGVAHALRRLREAGGAVEVRALAAELGWSRKHLAARFREVVGLPPKAVARILRFRRALRLLEGPPGAVPWSEVALRCGYYDQAHFNRDFRGFTGTTPRDYLRRRMGEGLDALAE